MRSCPEPELIDAALDGDAEPRVEAAVRAHVAGCERCLARHGAGFELELWGGALGPAASDAARESAPDRGRALRRRQVAMVDLRRLAPAGRGRLAAAACLLAAAGAASSWILHARGARGGGAAATAVKTAEATAAAELWAAPPLRVIDLETRVGTSGPDGAFVVTTTRREDEPFVICVVEKRRDRSGAVEEHERLLPVLGALAR